MALWRPEAFDFDPNPSRLEEQLAKAPDLPGVFLIAVGGGLPYVGRTLHLRRRLRRLLRSEEKPARLLNLRLLAKRVAFQRTASSLENSLLFHELARSCYPADYLRRSKLRMPPYVKIILSNPFPRSQVTTRLSGAPSLYYGPFRSRAGAESFEVEMLDLFQMRRCQEDLRPAPDHPGCIYGEMNLCLRPCQQAVSREEYAAETERVMRFLASDGKSLLEPLARQRDRASEELDFEQAARLHKQVEKVEGVLRLRDELACELDQLSGVAVTPAVEAGHVNLWFLLRGWWQAPVRFEVRQQGERPVPMDERLRAVTGTLQARSGGIQERQEHVALLARWFYSSHRDGEWIPFRSLEELPYRRLVRAISRTSAESASLGQDSGYSRKD
jgi:hypothetical protein